LVNNSSHNCGGDACVQVREECQSLLQEQKTLLDSATRLRSNLAYFEEAGEC
jgi:hypothetical protein